LSRILLLLLIAFLIYLVLRGYLRLQKEKKPPPAAPTTVSGEDMLACARCGVNVPRSELTEVDGRLVCAANPNCLKP
jgi:hypothetical protein